MKIACSQKNKWFLLLFSLAIVLVLFARIPLARERRMASALSHIKAASAEFHVPVAMILAVTETESDFYANAVSTAGARGLMQLMPQTFSWLREEELVKDSEKKDISDPATNIRYGTYYLSYLYNRFGNWTNALAAYNAGEGRVRAWQAEQGLGEEEILLSIPFSETRKYVAAVFAAYEKYSLLYPEVS